MIQEFYNCLLSIKERLEFSLWPLSVVRFNKTLFGILPLVCSVFLSCVTTLSDTVDITFCASKNDMNVFTYIYVINYPRNSWETRTKQCNAVAQTVFCARLSAHHAVIRKRSGHARLIHSCIAILHDTK